MLPRLFSNNKHLSRMTFRGGMALGTIFVTALFIVNLTVSSQLLKARCLHRIGKVFWHSNCSAGHREE